MSLFMLDTAGNQDLLTNKAFAKNEINAPRRLLEKNTSTQQSKNLFDVVLKEADEDSNESEDDGEYFGLPPPNVDISKLIESTLAATERHQTQIEQELSTASELVDAAVERSFDKRSKRKRITQMDYSDFNPVTGKFDEEKYLGTNVGKEIEKFDCVEGIEQMKEMQLKTKKRMRTLNRLEREKTKGAKWFNLPATEITEEVENDLKILQMRSVLDPKHFYKKNDLKVLPKYFQIGTVQHSALDHYSERGTRRNKKKSLVEELLADAQFQQYNKRKYQEVLARTDKYAHRKAMKKMKKLKKNKK